MPALRSENIVRFVGVTGSSGSVPFLSNSSGIDLQPRSKANSFNDLKAECLESVYFRGMIGEQAYLSNAEVLQYLRTDTVIVDFSITSFTLRGLKINIFFLHQRVRF